MVPWVDLCQLRAHINTSGRECTDLPSAEKKIINLIISIKVSSAAHQREMKKALLPTDVCDKLLLAADERWCERIISKQ